MIKENTIIKKDTSQNWAKARNFIPKKGEIIYYIDLNNYKIGDGNSLLQDLAFINNYTYEIRDGTLFF